jgi:nucleoside-diphosphate-sugar epimerase
VRIYVTGETGFIGSAFCRLAISRGHEVSGLKGARLNAPPWTAIREFAPDACVHTAWIATPGEYLTADVNRDYAAWSIAFLREMRALGTPTLVALGTCIEYAPSHEPMREGVTPLRPTSPYAISKNEVRKTMEDEVRGGRGTFAWARIFYPYGAGEHPRRLATSIARALIDDREVVLNTPASVKDYIHIDDVASALLAITEARHDGAINVGCGRGVEVREIARTLASLVGKPDLVREAATPAADEYPFVVADTSCLEGLGWQPKVALRDGLQNLVDTLS